MWISANCVAPGEERLQSAVEKGRAAGRDGTGTRFFGFLATWKLIFSKIYKMVYLVKNFMSAPPTCNLVGVFSFVL